MQKLFIHALLFAGRSVVAGALGVGLAARGRLTVFAFALGSVGAIGGLTYLAIITHFASWAVFTFFTLWAHAVGTFFIHRATLCLCLWTRGGLCDNRYSRYRGGGDTCRDKNFLHFVLSLIYDCVANIMCGFLLGKGINLIFLKNREVCFVKVVKLYRFLSCAFGASFPTYRYAGGRLYPDKSVTFKWINLFFHAVVLSLFRK